MKYLLLLFLSTTALAQTVTLTPSIGTGTGVTPILKWSSTPTGASCVGSGDADWNGTKAASGTQTLPKITAGKTYVLTCTWAGDTTATLAWTEPTANSDGSPLTNLASYKVYRSNDQTLVGSPGSLLKTVTAPASSAVFTSLPAGTHFFGVTAVNALGVESSMSNIASKVIAAASSASDSASIQFPGATILTVK